MAKKLTITIDEQVYKDLYDVIGKRKISQFIESLVRSHIVVSSLDAAYREMALNEAREKEAIDWAEATTDDLTDKIK